MRKVLVVACLWLAGCDATRPPMLAIRDVGVVDVTDGSDANPLDDITNTRKIRAVVADGRLYRRADLDRLLAELDPASTGR